MTKPRFLALGLVISILLIKGRGRAEGATEVYLGCGPLDGRTLELVVTPPPNHLSFKLTIWSRGYADLEKGIRDFHVGSDINIGQSSVCAEMVPGSPCTPDTINAHFTTLELREGGRVTGAIFWKKIDFPFTGTISSMKQCG